MLYSLTMPQVSQKIFQNFMWQLSDKERKRKFLYYMQSGKKLCSLRLIAKIKNYKIFSYNRIINMCNKLLYGKKKLRDNRYIVVKGRLRNFNRQHISTSSSA